MSCCCQHSFILASASPARVALLCQTLNSCRRDIFGSFRLHKRPYCITSSSLRQAARQYRQPGRSAALGVVVVGISYVSLILGELVPKRLALQNAEGIASVVAPIMHRLARIGSPIVGFLTISAQAVLWLLGRHNVAELPISEDDFMALVREGVQGGALDASEERLIGNVFGFTV
ncbi:MAG: CNNM domain-containing protein [Roseiflexaceae bacterium]